MTNYKPSAETIKSYNQYVIDILKEKYKIGEKLAKYCMKKFKWNELLVACNYIALHDDPEYVADDIYEFYCNNIKNQKSDLRKTQ